MTTEDRQLDEVDRDIDLVPPREYQVPMSRAERYLAASEARRAGEARRDARDAIYTEQAA